MAQSSRRTLLKGSVSTALGAVVATPALAAAAVSAPALAAPELNPDAELLSACRTIHAIDQAIGRPRMMRGTSEADVWADQATWNGPVLQARDLMARAANLPARTQEGLRAKAGVVRLFSPRREEWRLAVWLCGDGRITDLAQSLADDVAGRQA